MKVLVIGHAYTAAVNRTKWTTLVQQHPDLTLQVICPQAWPDVLFTVHAGDVSAENTERCTFIVLPTTRAGSESKYTYAWSDVARIVRGFSPDIIHVEQGTLAMSHWQVSMIAIIWAPAAKIIFFTWINWSEPRTWRYWMRWALVERSNMGVSAGAVVGNVAAKDLLRVRGFTKPVQVIPQLGADLDRYRPLDVVRTKTVLFLGRLVPEKGIFLLAHAFAHIRHEFPDWRLQYVGSGPCQQELVQTIARLGMSDCVSSVPSVAHTAIPAVINASSLLVLPSYDIPTWKEQFGLVLAEAMACRVPVIGSSAGAIAEVIGDAGLIFEQNNQEDLVRCLRLLMSDESARIHYAQRGYERAHGQLSRQAIARQTVEFWQSL